MGFSFKPLLTDRALATYAVSINNLLFFVLVYVIFFKIIYKDVSVADRHILILFARINFRQ